VVLMCAGVGLVGRDRAPAEESKIPETRNLT